VNRGEQKAGDKDEVIDEKPELHDVAAPPVGPMESEAEEQDVGGRHDRCVAEEEAGEECDRQCDLKDGRDPRE